MKNYLLYILLLFVSSPVWGQHYPSKSKFRPPQIYASSQASEYRQELLFPILNDTLPLIKLHYRKLVKQSPALMQMQPATQQPMERATVKQIPPVETKPPVDSLFLFEDFHTDRKITTLPMVGVQPEEKPADSSASSLKANTKIFLDLDQDSLALPYNPQVLFPVTRQVRTQASKPDEYIRLSPPVNEMKTEENIEEQKEPSESYITLKEAEEDLDREYLLRKNELLKRQLESGPESRYYHDKHSIITPSLGYVHVQGKNKEASHPESDSVMMALQKQIEELTSQVQALQAIVDTGIVEADSLTEIPEKELSEPEPQEEHLPVSVDEQPSTEAFAKAFPDTIQPVFFQESVYFQVNSSSLNEASKAKLYTLIEYLKTFPDKHLILKGYADSRGDKQLNMRLSRERAHSVRDYLYSQGIDLKRVSIQYFGADENESDFTLARRVEVVID
ncbi:OmpA family protein [Rapidithrix thailandica]|uniref:OmpA family protein n=1 Tax=Rapidithrix thailandica TaxID=413964 RepID=A0AAW9SE12_9BACT